MSDFFGDDFTAELKAYFLDSVLKEVDKFIDLVDESLWKRIRSEVVEQTQAWSVDAKTNEFQYLSEWLATYGKRSECIDGAQDLIRSLKALKSYVEALIVEKQDSAELAAKYTLVSERRHEVLFLHCKSGAQEFALPLLSVVEISSSVPLYSLPEKKQGLLGVIPFRGEAIPVISLQDHGFQSMENKNIYYVICEHQGVRFSLQVTETEDLVSLRESELQNVESHSAMIQASFVKQFFIKNSKGIMILDLEQLVA